MSSANKSLSIGTQAYSNEVSACFSYFSSLSSKEEITSLCNAAYKADITMLKPEVLTKIQERWPSILKNQLAGVPTQVPSTGRSSVISENYYVSSFNVTQFAPNVSTIKVQPLPEARIKMQNIIKSLMEYPQEKRQERNMGMAAAYAGIVSTVQHLDKDNVVVMQEKVHNGFLSQNAVRDRTASSLASVTVPEVTNGKLEIVSPLPEQKKCDKAGIVIDVGAESGLRSTVPTQFIPVQSQSAMEYAHNISAGFQNKSNVDMTKTSIFVTNTVHKKNIARLQKLGTAGKFYAEPRPGYALVPIRQITYRQKLKDEQLHPERAIKEINRRRGLLGENSTGPCGISVCGMYPLFFSKQQVDFYDRFLMLKDILNTGGFKEVLVLGLTGTEIQYLITNYYHKAILYVFGKIERQFSNTVRMINDYYDMRFDAVIDFSTGSVSYKEGESTEARMAKTKLFYENRKKKYLRAFGKDVQVFQNQVLPYFDFKEPFKGYYTCHNGTFMTGIPGNESQTDFLRRVITYNIYRSNYHLVQAPFYVIYPEMMEKVRAPILDIELHAPFVEQSTKSFLNFVAEDWDSEMAIPDLESVWKHLDFPDDVTTTTTTTTTSSEHNGRRRKKKQLPPEEEKKPEKKKRPKAPSGTEYTSYLEFDEDSMEDREDSDD